MKSLLRRIGDSLGDPAMYGGILAEMGFVILLTGACALACLLLSLL
jgi:hypothetical protein